MLKNSLQNSQISNNPSIDFNEIVTKPNIEKTFTLNLEQKF